MSVYVRYRADIWAEVSRDGEIVTVVVDVDSMVDPLDVLSADGEPVDRKARADAIEAAQSQEWPTWDYGPSSVTRSGDD
jgi:hypothetical protein